MINTILQQIVDGVNWVVVFYVLFALGVLYVAHRIGISPPHLLRDLTHEIVLLLTRPEISRTTIDASITLALIVITILVGLYCFMHEMPNALSIFTKGVEGEGQPVFLFIIMVFMLIVGGILSLFVTRREVNTSRDDDSAS